MSDPVKRRRVQPTPSPEYRLDDEGDYEPYIPVAQRRQARLARLSAWGSSAGPDRVEEARRVQEEREDEEQEEERRRERVRRGRALLVEAQEVHSKKASEGMWSLHLLGVLRCKSADAKKTEAEKAEEADAQILAAIASRKKLASDMELAKGIEYTEALRTSCVALLSARAHYVLIFLDGYPHAIFVRGLKMPIERFVRNTILLLTAKTFPHQSTHLRYACSAYSSGRSSSVE
jgi:hypothetical protein